jgi:hypothetical protein
MKDNKEKKSAMNNRSKEKAQTYFLHKEQGPGTPKGGQEKLKCRGPILNKWCAYLIAIALSCKSPHNLGRLLDDEDRTESLEKSQDRVRSSNDCLPDPM